VAQGDVTAGPSSEFDRFAESYEDALSQGLRFSGESSDFFADGRIRVLEAHLRRLGHQPVSSVLDFGCGNGSTAPLLARLDGVKRVVGVDTSTGLLDLARETHASPSVEFMETARLEAASFDVAYCNGVFHHIPHAARPAAVASVWSSLRPGGLFAFCENNPWNPGTRIVMRSIPFDRDADTLSPPQARRLLQAAGFRVLATSFMFFFPRPLHALRRWEARLARVPLGAQYMMLVRRPD
jgi:SAM-dependent methyltransferase